LHLIAAELCGYALSIGLLLVVSESLVATFPPLGPVMRSVLAVYLVWLAGRLWNANLHQVEARTVFVTWRRVFVTTLLNPKGVVIALLFPRLLTPSDLAWYGMAFALTTLVIACGWLLFGSTVGRVGGSRAVALVPRLAALVLLAFATIAAGSAILGASFRGRLSESKRCLSRKRTRLNRSRKRCTQTLCRQAAVEAQFAGNHESAGGQPLLTRNVGL
jgi:threonine/homoserine/homoserine lactone efflux protein